MKKLISAVLTVVMLASVFALAGTSQAAAKTTFNGKAAVKGEIVFVDYQLKAPEKMEDIQATITYTSGLKLMGVTYSKQLKTGSFVSNEKLSKSLKFNAVCINTPMNFTKNASLIKLKFKITSTGAKKTTLNLECLDSTAGRSYGSTQNKTNYKKLKITTKNSLLAYSLKLNKTSLKLKKGKTYKLKATINPTTASKKVKWTTNKKSVATVNASGKVTAKKKGTCYITCKTKDGSNKTKKCKVTVK